MDLFHHVLNTGAHPGFRQGHHNTQDRALIYCWALAVPLYSEIVDPASVDDLLD